MMRPWRKKKGEKNQQTTTNPADMCPNYVDLSEGQQTRHRRQREIFARLFFFDCCVLFLSLSQTVVDVLARGTLASSFLDGHNETDTFISPSRIKIGWYMGKGKFSLSWMITWCTLFRLLVVTLFFSYYCVWSWTKKRHLQQPDFVHLIRNQYLGFWLKILVILHSTWWHVEHWLTLWTSSVSICFLSFLFVRLNRHFKPILIVTLNDFLLGLAHTIIC